MWSAAAVGRAMTQHGAVPDSIVSSPALRARTTATLARDAGGWEAAIDLVDGLYDGGVTSVFEALRARNGRVLAVGHEPTWSMAVASLIGGGSIQMVTAAVACLECPGDPGPGQGALRWMIHPRMLEAR